MSLSKKHSDRTIIEKAKNIAMRYDQKVCETVSGEEASLLEPFHEYYSQIQKTSVVVHIRVIFRGQIDLFGLILKMIFNYINTLV